MMVYCALPNHLQYKRSRSNVKCVDVDTEILLYVFVYMLYTLLISTTETDVNVYFVRICVSFVWTDMH